MPDLLMMVAGTKIAPGRQETVRKDWTCYRPGRHCRATGWQHDQNLLQGSFGSHV